MNFEDLFSFYNLLSAWEKFRRGKTRRGAVIFFERFLEDNLLTLSEDLLSEKWRHSRYRRFFICDPKKRDIYVPEMKDRVVHQIIHNLLENIYEPSFIRHSFASRKGKGTIEAVASARYFLESEASWNCGHCFALKCDIRKYFDNVNHQTLLSLMSRKIKDEKIFGIIEEIVRSFRGEAGIGIPLGNITSQIFANIYLNELDIFIKKGLKFSKYVRYNDDFLLIGADKSCLLKAGCLARDFVREKLRLEIPPEKFTLRKFRFGIHFLGRIIIPGAVLLRRRTIKKVFRNVSNANAPSYLGLLRSADSFVARRRILADFRFSDLC